jgi:hypothetical protein
MWQIKDNAADDIYHLKANGFANCWYIDGPAEDEARIKMEFAMQSFFIRGLFVSGASIILMSLIVLSRKKSNNGKN